MRRLLLDALLAWGFAAQADNTSSGHSFTPPESFTVSATGPILRLTAPEGDANITVVNLTAVTDTDDAVAQA